MEKGTVILHTDIPTRLQVDRLLRDRDPTSLSIYLPTDPASSKEAKRIESATLRRTRSGNFAGPAARDGVAAIEEELGAVTLEGRGGGAARPRSAPPPSRYAAPCCVRSNISRHVRARARNEEHAAPACSARASGSQRRRRSGRRCGRRGALIRADRLRRSQCQALRQRGATQISLLVRPSRESAALYRRGYLLR